MQEIAEKLKKQREVKGLTLDDLFQRTRINIDYLKALEAGQFDMLPNTYAKLFIKKFAQEIGLNVEEILALYDQKAPREEPAKRPPPPAHRERNFQPVILIAVGVFIVALLVWQINQQDQPGTASPLDATLSSPVTQQRANQPATSNTSQTVVQPIQTDVQDEEISPTETTGITTIASSNTPTETTLTPESIQNPEPLLEDPSAPAPQPVASPQETISLPNTQTEVLRPETETTAQQPTTEPVAENIQASEPISEPIAEDLVDTTPVTQSQTSERLIAEEQTLSENRIEPIIKPLPIQIAPGNPILLSGIVQETTQIVVKADGRILFDGELQTGSRPRWMARESLELTLTNQNAIVLSLQNQPLQFNDITTQNIQLNINRTQIHISPSEQ